MNDYRAPSARATAAQYDERGVRTDSVTNQLRLLNKHKSRKRPHPVLQPIDQATSVPTNNAATLARTSVQRQIQGPVSLQWVVDDFVQAAGTGDLAKVDHYIRGGVPIDMQHSVLHQTALHASAALHDDAVTRHLVQAGADVNALTKNHESALHLAARYHSSVVAQEVLRNQADLAVLNTRQMLAMDVAAEIQDHKLGQLLEPPPPAPSNVRATNVSSTSITLAWESHANTSSTYQFRVSWVLSGSLGDTSDTCSSASFRLTNLMPASQYEIRVQTGNHTVGWSDSSELLVLETDGDVPNAMAAPFITRVSDHSLSMRIRLPSSNGAAIQRVSIQLQCTGSLAEVSTSSIRKLLRPSDQDTRWESVLCDVQLMRTSDSSVHEKDHTVEGLLPGHVYYVRVKACNRFGWSPDGEVSDGICTNAAPSVVATTARSVTLVWTKPYSTELIDQYHVQARASYSTKWDIVASDLVDQRAQVDGLVPATLYSFRVVPHYAISGWDDAEVCAFTELCGTRTTVPEPPPGLRLVDRTAQTIVLSWDMPRCNGHAVESYRVEQRVVDKGEWTLVSAEVPVDSSTFTVADLTRGTAYEFRVSARNAMGDSPFATWPHLPVWTYSFLPPTAPICVEKSSFSLTISWLSGDNEDTEVSSIPALYEVEICQVDSSLRSSSDIADVVQATGEWRRVGVLQRETRALVSGLQPLCCYCFRVRACLENGADSDEASSVFSPISALTQTLRRM